MSAALADPVAREIRLQLRKPCLPLRSITRMTDFDNTKRDLVDELNPQIHLL